MNSTVNAPYTTSYYDVQGLVKDVQDGINLYFDGQLDDLPKTPENTTKVINKLRELCGLLQMPDDRIKR